MNKIRVITAISMALYLQVGPASPQERSTDVNENITIEDGWARFVDLCGLVLSDPDAYVAGLPDVGPLGEKVRTDYSDGLLVITDLQNGRINESVHVSRFGSVVHADCHFNFRPANFSDKDTANREFADLLAVMESLNYVGCYGNRQLPGVINGASVFDVDGYQYQIINVWGRRDISVQVTISDHSFYAGVTGAVVVAN